MLRDYQLECIEKISDRRGHGQLRQLIVLPTGTGKTHVFAHLRKHLGLPAKVRSLQSRFPRKNFVRAESMEEVRAIFEQVDRVCSTPCPP